ncbi:MAG: sugar phosphate isomerase/epimerase family protein [Kiritimatiellales bacterium]
MAEHFRTAFVIFCLMAFTACMQVKSSDPLVQIGFTTQNFLPAVPVSVESAKQFISYAKAEGFSWVELRDPDVSLTSEQCSDIASFAEQNGIEVAYSMQRGLLAEDFNPAFEKALENMVLFNGPNVVRVLALRGGGELGWDEAEFSRMVHVADRAAKTAEGLGYRLMIENADAVLDGSGKNCFGMMQLLDAVSPSVELQLDTANLFTGPEPVSPEQAEAFICRYADRISYVHLKSALNREAQPVLCGNPLDFRKIFDLLAENGSHPYVAIELASGNASAKQVYKNMQISREWLQKEK